MDDGGASITPLFQLFQRQFAILQNDLDADLHSGVREEQTPDLAGQVLAAGLLVISETEAQHSVAIAIVGDDLFVPWQHCEGGVDA